MRLHQLGPSILKPYAKSLDFETENPFLLSFSTGMLSLKIKTALYSEIAECKSASGS